MFVYKDKKFTQEQVEQAAKNANMTVDEYLKANPDITLVVEDVEEDLIDPMLKEDFDWSSWKGELDSLTDKQYEAFHTYNQAELYKRYPEEQRKADIKKLENFTSWMLDRMTDEPVDVDANN